MAGMRVLSSIATMRRILLHTSVLSGGLMLVAVPEAKACVTTSNSTLCSEGTATTDIILPSESYVSGNYNVAFHNYQLIGGGGLKLSDVVGNSIVTFSNSSLIDGGVFATFNEAAIYVAGSGAGTIDVTLQDNSSVHSTGNGIQVSSDNFSSASTVSVNTGSGSVVGDDGYGIYAGALGADVSVNVQGEVSGGLAGIAGSSLVGNVSITTSDAAVSSRNYWGIWGDSSRDISINAGGDVTGTQGIVATGSSGLTEVKTADGSLVRGTAGAGLIANGGSVIVDAYSDITGTDLGLYSVAFNGPSTIKTFGSIKSSAGYGILASSNSFSDADNLQIIASGDVSGQLDGIRGYTLFSSDVIVSANAKVKGVEGNGITGLNYNSGNIDVLTGTNAVVEGGQFGIWANANSGYVNIVNNGIVRGNSAVQAQSMANIFIENGGIIENSTLATSDLAISTTGSSMFLSNALSGVITGRIEMGDEIAHDDIFNNFGLWRTNGLSYFSGGEDILANAGIIQFGNIANAAETAGFLELEQFQNSGLLSGMEQASGDGSTFFDSLSLSGDYIGHAGAVLALDVYLGGPGSLADVLTVDGHTSGQTLVRLNNTNAGLGSINEAGIVLVDVTGTSTAADFALERGPVINGLYAYDLEYRAREAGASFALVSAPSAQAGELVELVNGLQNIWSGGMNAWSLRQATLRDVIAGRTRITAASSDGLAENAGVRQVWAAPRGEWSKRETAGTFGSTAHRQSTYGLDGGVDFGVDVAADADVLFGLVGGYATSQVNYLNSASGIDIEGGSLGAYAGFVSHGFFADALLKHDWMNLDYTAAGAGSANTEARSLGLAADVGYRFGSGQSFVEPLVSFSTIKTQAEDFTISGSLVSPGKNIATRVGAGVRFGVNESVFNSLFTARMWESLGGENQLGFGTAALPIGGSKQGTMFELSSHVSVDVSEQAKVFVNGTTYLSKDETAASLSAGLTAQW
jgi:autotransporter family porin